MSLTKKARQRRLERGDESAERRGENNSAQRIRTFDNHVCESREQRDNRLQEDLSRTRAAREQHIDLIKERDRLYQQTRRALTRESFVCLVFNYAPDFNYSADPKVTISSMDKVFKSPKKSIYKLN